MLSVHATHVLCKEEGWYKESGAIADSNFRGTQANVAIPDTKLRSHLKFGVSKYELLLKRRQHHRHSVKQKCVETHVG